MDIKMIVMDLDRTMLRTDKSISEYTRNILSKCKRNGIKLVIASARAKRSVINIANDIGCDDIICLNGAMIIINDKVFDKKPINKDIAQEFIVKLKDMFPKSKLSAEIDDFIYANFDLNEMIPNVANFIMTDFNNIPNDVDKIIIGLENKKDIEKINSILPKDLYGKIAVENLLQIMSCEATKLNGIKLLAEYYNIGLNEIAAFGDDNDDIEMIKHCGCGVAVANAIKEVLSVANYITESNEYDGVAKWIEYNLL